MSDSQGTTWDHATVYKALVARGDKENVDVQNSYVHLYPQKPNCAILYRPGGRFDRCPLHFHPGQPSWRPAVYKALLKAISSGCLEKSIPPQRPQSFIDCAVDNWDEFAKAMGLGTFPRASK